jgi:hypothetical protein
MHVLQLHQGDGLASFSVSVVGHRRCTAHGYCQQAGEQHAFVYGTHFGISSFDYLINTAVFLSIALALRMFYRVFFS